MLEPRAAIFAQRLRERQRIFPAGSDLARTLLAKYPAFHRERTDLPVLTYHQLAGLTSASAGIDQRTVELRSPRASVQFSFADAAAAPLVPRPAPMMIQRRSLSSESPARGGFPTGDALATPRSPVLSEALPFEQSRAAISLFGAGRLSDSLAGSGETPPAGPPARTARRVGFLRPAPAALGRPRASLTPLESIGPGYTASMVWPAGSGERLPPPFLAHQPAVIGEQARDDEVGERASSPSGPALPPILRDMPVVKRPGIKSGPVFSAKSTRARSASSIGIANLWLSSESRVHASPVEAFHSELLWHDIRMNPLGRSLPLEKQIASVAAMPAAALDLTLQLPLASGVPGATAPGHSLAAGEEVAAKSITSEMRPAAGPQLPTVTEVADKVYRLLERRLVVERERRGVFRS